MQQISDWLESLGLSEYAQRFAQNDIDFSILADLTDQDLEKIGVTSLGHRRKILRSITALDGASAGPAPVATTSPPRAAPAPPVAPAAAEAAGERRYLTVMFCDLVGSTAISAQLDAEDWRDLVGSYLDAASAAVTEMGGHVAKKLGDGILAFFGYPVAHENDAERAARAALSISARSPSSTVNLPAPVSRNCKRGSGLKPDLRCWMRAARFSGTSPILRHGCRRLPSPVQC